jgi:hypothetical protein
MKTKLFFGIVAAAIMAVSCSMNETEEVNIATADAIALNPNTAVTRASITYLQTLKDAQNGFAVYAENPSSISTSSWYPQINGSNNHYFDGSKWNFITLVKWPVNTTDYPMTFFAYYPTALNTVVTSVDKTYPDVKLNVTIPSEVSKQLDVLAGKNTANSKPSTSILSMQFDHIFSKIFFTVSNRDKNGLNTTQNAYVQAIGFDHLYKTNTFDVRLNKWGVPANNMVDYNYYNEFAPLTTGIYTEKKFNSADKGKFYTGNVFDDSYMMLLPQDPKVWSASGNPVVAPTATEAYVRMLYRVEETSPVDNDYIGYKSAITHPNYAGSATEQAGYKGPLYVKVGYSYSPSWVAGKGYQYDIPIPGTTGGRLLDENYYDEQGNRTDLEVENLDVPDQIITSDEYIHLKPIVTDWDDLVGSVIER